MLLKGFGSSICLSPLLASNLRDDYLLLPIQVDTVGYRSPLHWGIGARSYTLAANRRGQVADPRLSIASLFLLPGWEVTSLVR